MIIMVRTADNRVIHADTDLVLTDTGLKCPGWVDHNYHIGNAILISDVKLPEFWAGGVWSYVDGVWAIADQARYDEIVAQFNVEKQAKIAVNLELLWQAAHDYEYASINGMAIGLLVIGVLQSKPKAMTIKQWSNDIWTLYYQHKLLLTEHLDSTLNDFSSVGNMPYSIPELMAEVLV
ncbi:hypothetical protein [Candidatus Methylobacter oryzae]|uniref:Uncharacterized protein n=1 Tax=Candidatus Methylobacter oryzae TaxID=2497749 RepID=A0ABY3C930_9GAMM|nr:hypothetical protein [Candidatus Methylobacter oryzae]TRW92804.1 hypothetical protein EKO24_014485 [Candidatus Methylobacter oryzae]